MSSAPVAAESSLWARYLSWSSFFKIVGVILLLVAFASSIALFATSVMKLIVKVPKELYQTVFLGLSLTGTLWPEQVWASQAFYLALFCAFANVILSSWVAATHPQLEAWVVRLINGIKLGIPFSSAVSFLGMLYFGALALAYQSEIFGFFAIVCLSGVLSFGLYYRPGVLTLHFREKALNAVVFGHLLVLLSYAGLKVSGHLPAQAAFFVAGLAYYCTIAMGVGFLVGASPGGRKSTAGFYLLLFSLVLFGAMFGYFFWDLKVIGSILCCIAVLLALEWIAYLSYQVNFVFCSLVLGVALYGGSLLLEAYGPYIVLRLA